MAQIVLNPALLDHVEYNILKQDGEWICLAGHLPIIGDISGHGSDPKNALQDCRSRLLSSFETINA